MRIVYSPMDALTLARKHTDREVVFFAVGFETTAPANAMAVAQAARLGVKNFSVLVSQVLVPPAIRAILEAPQSRVQAFLAAGHVSTVMGLEQYRPLAEKYRVPIVATGFEPLDILQGVAMCVRQLEEGRSEVENQYARSVRPEGNREAIRLMEEVFERCRANGEGSAQSRPVGWRFGRGWPRSTPACGSAWRRSLPTNRRSALQARCSGVTEKPFDCPAFGVRCTPDRPLGAPMVSSEGSCAAYFRYRRRAK